MLSGSTYRYSLCPLRATACALYLARHPELACAPHQVVGQHVLLHHQAHAAQAGERPGGRGKQGLGLGGQTGFRPGGRQGLGLGCMGQAGFRRGRG